jgi:proteasome lid subunit RPN8/RPN11
MNVLSKLALAQCLAEAVQKCTFNDSEEHGGFIIRNESEDLFEFHLVKNLNEGQPRARVLYTADIVEHYEKIRKKTEPRNAKWVEYATFHTHPPGCGPFPSRMDYDELFTSSPINYIYAPHTIIDCKLMKYTYDPDKKVWLANKIYLDPQ